MELAPPSAGDDWVGLSEFPLPVGAVLEWITGPRWGAQVVFTGTVRDSAEGRTDVSWLEYEAYTEQVEPRLVGLAGQIRVRWPEAGRIALLHRTGRLDLCETAVAVAVSAPHRPAAFEAARFGIDALKATVPIWKKEHWRGGEDWGTGATPVAEVSAQP